MTKLSMSKLSTPLKIGLIFGLIGLSLTIVGIVRGTVPPNPASIAMALLIGGGVWFVVSWAVATAAVDVEQDLAEAQDEVQGDTA
jgi:hypothetical protein